MMVYAVCSTEPEENEEIVKGFLKNHPDFAIEHKIEGMPSRILSLVDRDGFLRTDPRKNDMDGFFSVCLKKVK